jgi:hypothetical protein
MRGAQQIELSLKLRAPSDQELGFESFSKHAHVPPTVITTDIPVLPYECGAPAVGRDATAVGLVISRFGPTGSYIIPGDCIAARLTDLMSGKPLSGFPVQPAAPVPRASSRN